MLYVVVARCVLLVVRSLLTAACRLPLFVVGCVVVAELSSWFCGSGYRCARWCSLFGVC